MCRFAPIALSTYHLSYHSLVLGSGFLMARATVSPMTDLAPLSHWARAQAFNVAPVVNTLSTSKTRRLSTWLPGRVAKAPRTDPSAPPNSALADQSAPA